MATSFAVLIATVILIQNCFAQQANQKITLYTGLDGTGEFLLLNEVENANLSAEAFDDKTQSVCATGMWLLYEHGDYNELEGQVEYIYGNNSCVNLNGLREKVSSVRFAGWAQDYQGSTVTLYEGSYFQGKQQMTLNNVENITLDGGVGSLIITGLNTWTIYNDTEFQGESHCIQPPKPHYTPGFVMSLNNSISSVKMNMQWCFNEQNVINLESPEVSLNSTDNTVDSFATKNKNNFTLHGVLNN